MEVHGRDIETECYRVTHEVDGQKVMALVPERLAADLRPTRARPRRLYTSQRTQLASADAKAEVRAVILTPVRRGAEATKARRAAATTSFQSSACLLNSGGSESERASPLDLPPDLMRCE